MFGTKKIIDFTCEVTGKIFEHNQLELNFVKKFNLCSIDRSPLERIRYVLGFVPDLYYLKKSSNILLDQEFAIPIISKKLDPIEIDSSKIYSSVLKSSLESNNISSKNFFSELKLLIDKISLDGKNQIESTNLNISEVTYSEHLFGCKNLKHCYDCSFVIDSEGVAFSKYSINCKNSYFLENCINCEECLFCTNIENSRFKIFNKQMSEQEYRETLASLLLWESSHLDSAKERFATYLKTSPLNTKSIYNSEDANGRFIYNSKNINTSFLLLNSENCYSSFSINNSRNCFGSAFISNNCENIFSSSCILGAASNIICSYLCGPNIENLYYSLGCSNSSNLFGCVGLQDREYCILNYQFSKNEYKKYFKIITDKLKQNSTLGSFLPLNFSLIPYNFSLANLLFPLGKIQAEIFGARWEETITDTNINTELDICEISAEPFKTTTHEKELLDVLKIYKSKRSPNQNLKEKILALELGEEKEFNLLNKKTILSYYKGNRTVLT